jgi:hypothetical protein
MEKLTDVFRVSISDQGKMRINLFDSGAENGSAEIEVYEASQIATAVLLAAREYQHPSGRAYDKDAQRLSALAPSGVNFASSHVPGCISMIFHFGETSLGIAIPLTSVKEIGERLMALGATGAAH